MKVQRLHHAQITIPPHEEEAAREFYCGLLGLTEVEKPDSLKAKGGFWVACGDLQIHVSIEAGFDRLQTKTHLAYQVDEVAAWRAKLRAAGYDVKGNTPIPGFDRVEFRDPFGNRIELIQAL